MLRCSRGSRPGSSSSESGSRSTGRLVLRDWVGYQCELAGGEVGMLIHLRKASSKFWRNSRSSGIFVKTPRI